MQVCNNTTPNDIFGPLLKYMEKKTKNEMQPIGGKNLLLFLDDLDLNENSELAEPLRFFKENHTWIYQNELKYFDKVTVTINAPCKNCESASGESDWNGVSLTRKCTVETNEEQKVFSLLLC